jgi:putative RecB family exonuclease
MGQAMRGVRLSYSSISTYETCPAKWRFQYRERLPTVPSPALTFGDSVHRALRRFHDRPVPVAPGLPELMDMLDQEWASEGYRDPNEEALYRDHARQVLRQYHLDNAAHYRIPAALEHRFRIEVEGVPVSGVIDRMDRLPGGGYEIIDYKTNRRLPPRVRLERDLQLSVYALAAREVWGIEPERLTLYYLLPGQRMTSARTPEHLDDLRRRVATVAERIEAGMFEPRENPLCGWCDFQARCPLFRHRDQPHEAPRMAEIVEEWIRLKREDRERFRRLEELGGLLRAYAEEHGFRRLYGSDGAVALADRVESAPDTEAVRGLLEPLGLWEAVQAVDAGALEDLIEGGTLPPDVEEALLSSPEIVRRSTALYLRDVDRTPR